MTYGDLRSTYVLCYVLPGANRLKFWGADARYEPWVALRRVEPGKIRRDKPLLDNIPLAALERNRLAQQRRDFLCSVDVEYDDEMRLHDEWELYSGQGGAFTRICDCEIGFDSGCREGCDDVRGNHDRGLWRLFPVGGRLRQKTNADHEISFLNISSAIK